VANHYETLGLKRGCTPDEIKSAYRKLVLKHHPDHAADPKSRDVFIRVTQAYEVLGDIENRREYDRLLFIEDQKREAARTAIRATPQPKPKAPPKKTETIAVELTRLVQLFSRGRIMEAEAMARDLIRRAPQEAIPYGVLGDILRSRGNLVEASKMYAYAAQFDPRNPIYQRRHEELIESGVATGSTIHVARDRSARPGPLMAGLIVCLLSGIYLVLTREKPILPSFGPISTFSLGLVSVLFFAGITAGASLAMGGWLDRFESTTVSALGQRSPTAVLGYVAVANFWAAALLYVFLGLGQQAFNYSTSRVVGAVGGLVLLFTACAAASYALNALQVLAWGGNFTYVGALMGWMVADAFRR
jgi:hypothetical protein